MCIAFSVAELVSAYPTAGALYFTVSRLAPKEWVPLISWIVAWLNLLGQLAGAASSNYGSAQILLAAIQMAGKYTEAADGSVVFNYVPSNDTTVWIMILLCIFVGLVNSLPTYWIGKVTGSFVFFHAVVIISCSIALLVVTQPKHDATYVFTHVESSSGWQPPGWSFLFGFLSVSWGMTGYDATAHIIEEIKRPELRAPWAIVGAFGTMYFMGFLFNIVLSFCMKDPARLLASVQPVAMLFFYALGQKGGVVYTICAFIILQFGSISAVQSAARTVFAFSRDGLLPGSKIWVRVERRTQIPLLAVWFCTFWCIAIGLIGLGSYVAVGGLFSVTAIALDWSYCIPILCKVMFGKFEPGPWNLGRAGYYINIFACLWTLFVSVIFVLPIQLPVTASNMNYASAYLALILVFAGTYWLLGARKYYKGPLIETGTMQDEYPDRSGGRDMEYERLVLEQQQIT